MNHPIARQLQDWAIQYNCPDFICSDPVQFPHRYSRMQDIEISAFLTAWISYGNRKAIIGKGEELDSLFDGSPFSFIVHKKYENYRNNRNCFYRFFKYHDLYEICDRLYSCYRNYSTLQEVIKTSGAPSLLQKMQDIFADVTGIPAFDGNSACKRLCMFLRWMVRQDKIVDFGIWNFFSPRELLLPLDTHVHEMALELGITRRRCADMKTTQEITAFMNDIFPGDPCLGDFALFGYGINR